MSDPAAFLQRSGHVRFPEREGVLTALRRLGVVSGAPVPVWPPRPLPHGVFVSPPTNGWVVLWAPLDDLPEWLPELSASLECPAVTIEVAPPEYWGAAFYRDRRLLGVVELPRSLVHYDLVAQLAAEQLEAEGRDPDDAKAVERRVRRLRAAPEVADMLAEYDGTRPQPEDLPPFLPAGATPQQAWEVLTALDRDVGEDWERGGYDAEEYARRFSALLGLPDATWSPREDLEAFAEGDYDEGGDLPPGWREFVVAPTPRLRVLPAD